MRDQLLTAVVNELKPALEGRAWGKVWQLAPNSLAVDFRLNGGRYLFLSVEPNQPRLHLVARAVRELERQSLPPSGFVHTLRKQLGGARLEALDKDADDRVVRFAFTAYNEAGVRHARALVAQLTGRTSNLFLLGEEGRVLDALRPARGEGQETGEQYRPPARGAARAPAPAGDEGTTQGRGRASSTDALLALVPGEFPSLSDALDEHYRSLEAARAFDARAAALDARLRQEIAKREKLRGNLERDRLTHGDADEHKRVGDLLLANLSTAERRGARVRLTDYYAEDAPAVEFEVDENATLQEEAARRFARYAKAKRAAREIDARLAAVGSELDELAARHTSLRQIVAARDAAALEELAAQLRAGRRAGGRPEGAPGGARQVKPGGKAGGEAAYARRYRSSDGYEILVGRAAKDNDQLTFKIARPYDLWLHAADYPGSHVVVRNHRRQEDVPHRTVVEAAQLAAHHSQAKRDAKVAVNYTQRKFVSKPKGAAPGLVRLASFRTLMVEPREAAERI